MMLRINKEHVVTIHTLYKLHSFLLSFKQLNNVPKTIWAHTTLLHSKAMNLIPSNYLTFLLHLTFPNLIIKSLNKYLFLITIIIPAKICWMSLWLSCLHNIFLKSCLHAHKKERLLLTLSTWFLGFIPTFKNLKKKEEWRRERMNEPVSHLTATLERIKAEESSKY